MSTIQEVILQTNETIIRSGTAYHQRSWKSDARLWDVLARVMDLSNHDLLNHSIRVSNFAAQIARRLGLTIEAVELIIRASLFHDIGKLAISQSILAKPGSLTPKEYRIVKTHTELGAALLQECSDACQLIPIVRHHHEFFNGKGYPDRISGHEIEIEARIISVADAIDTMNSDRPYRRALPIQQIITELHKSAGTQFDPLVVEAAIPILKEIASRRQIRSRSFKFLMNISQDLYKLG